jgi:hypothetical protein
MNEKNMYQNGECFLLKENIFLKLGNFLTVENVSHCMGIFFFIEGNFLHKWMPKVLFR